MPLSREESELQEFLRARIEHGLSGHVSDRSVEDILDEEISEVERRFALPAEHWVEIDDYGAFVNEIEAEAHARSQPTTDPEEPDEGQ